MSGTLLLSLFNGGIRGFGEAPQVWLKCSPDLFALITLRILVVALLSFLPSCVAPQLPPPGNQMPVFYSKITNAEEAKWDGASATPCFHV